MGSYEITLIPGDGIGPEITKATLAVIEATGVEIKWDKQIAGQEAMPEYGQPVPNELLDSIRKNSIALKGPITTVVGKGFRSANVTLRKELDLYANLRPVKSIPGIKSRYEDIDLVIVRENTEDLYSGIEHVIAPGISQSIKVITALSSARIARWAFNYAQKKGRKKITVGHKANIMKLSDGLFLDSAQEVSREFPEIEYNERIIDNLCMQLVMNPHQFDILLLSNLYGDIVSDLVAGMVGGLGVVPGANIGDKYAVFEAVHGSAPDIAGKNIANPTAMIFSALLMLRHLGENEAADRIFDAVTSVYKEGKYVTRDIGGEADMTEFADAVIKKMESLVKAST
jgi:isocitrate dehydrogenase (NAD+)